MITGKLAEKIVKKRVQESDVEAEVITIPVKVAALIPFQLILKTLHQKDLTNVGSIIVPGLLAGDVSWIGEEIGVKTFKGPKNAADLPHVLKLVDKSPLSTTTPACELIREDARKRAEEKLKIIYEKANRIAKLGQAISIGSGNSQLFIKRKLPPIVLAEIVDVPVLTDQEIRETAIYYAHSGADIIDIGMIPGGGNADKAKRAIRTVKNAVSKPVSIDTLDIKEMKAAVDAGIDLILSLNSETLPEARFAHHTPIVITPSTSNGSYPTKFDERIECLEENIRNAIRLGYRRIIADPILTPLLTSSLTESLVSYHQFIKRNSETPILFGVGNVTELLDADSLGANILLAGIGYELQASILLTTEASPKTKGCVKELKTAVKMILLAKNRESPPKDLGLNLFVLKDKVAVDEEQSISLRKKILTLKQEYMYNHDPEGYMKVLLDRKSGDIHLVHHSYKKKKPTLVIQGKDPLTLCNTAISHNLISRPDHAAYIGIELYKAHLALITGKSYIQDKPLFEIH